MNSPTVLKLVNALLVIEEIDKGTLPGDCNGHGDPGYVQRNGEHWTLGLSPSREQANSSGDQDEGLVHTHAFDGGRIRRQ